MILYDIAIYFDIGPKLTSHAWLELVFVGIFSANSASSLAVENTNRHDVSSPMSSQEKHMHILCGMSFKAADRT